MTQPKIDTKRKTRKTLAEGLGVATKLPSAQILIRCAIILVLLGAAAAAVGLTFEGFFVENPFLGSLLASFVSFAFGVPIAVFVLRRLTDSVEREASERENVRRFRAEAETIVRQLAHLLGARAEVRTPIWEVLNYEVILAILGRANKLESHMLGEFTGLVSRWATPEEALAEIAELYCIYANFYRGQSAALRLGSNLADLGRYYPDVLGHRASEFKDAVTSLESSLTRLPSERALLCTQSVFEGLAKRFVQELNGISPEIAQIRLKEFREVSGDFDLIQAVSARIVDESKSISKIWSIVDHLRG